MDAVSAAADPGHAEVAWQTVVGAIGIVELFVDLIQCVVLSIWLEEKKVRESRRMCHISCSRVLR